MAYIAREEGAGMRDNDAVFKQIASIYTDVYGQRLTDENASLHEQHPGVSLPEARMEKRVMDAVRRDKRRPYYIGSLTLLAACFVAAFLFLVPLRYAEDARNMSTGAGGEFSVMDSPAADAPAMDAPVMEEEQIVADGSETSVLPPAIEEDAASSNVIVQDDALSAAEDAAPPVSEFDVIPLRAELPQGFTQTGFEQDKGQSIYYIEDVFLDDVVMTLEYADLPEDLSDLTEISIAGLTAYGTQTSTYSLLLFSIDDVLYTLTSEHDINTLIRLSLAFV